MTYEEAKKQLKGHLVDYLREEHNIDVSQSKKNFHCLAGTHEDKKPSMSLHPSGEFVRCFSCDTNLDIIDLIKIDKKLDTKEAFNYGYKRYNIHVDEYQKNSPSGLEISKPAAISRDISPPPYRQPINANRSDIEAYIETCSLRLSETDYHTKRGLSLETCKRFKIGYDPHFTESTGGEVWKALIIPTGKETYSARNTDPNADSSKRYRKHGEANLLNIEALKGNKPLLVVEGEIDALSIIEAGGEAIALGSTANKDKLIEAIKAEGTNPDLFFILMLDNDKAGDQTTEELKEKLEAIEYACITPSLPSDYKDPNDMLINDRERLEGFIKDLPQSKEEAEAKQAEEERREYEKTSALFDLNTFLKDIKKRTNCTPTGYRYLDEILDGGLYAGLYFIGAISSLGKTTLALQIADQIANQQRDVLIFSLEMDKKELIAKSLSRYTYLLDQTDTKTLAKTTRGILTGSRYEKYSKAEKDLIEEAIREYAMIAAHIYISVGVGDLGAEEIRKAIEKHVRATGRTPVIIIDYLQILAPYNERYTDKQNTDKAVLELKRISRDFETPIIGVSSFNRDNYNEPVNLSSFKESGAIEYSSDVLIGLQYQGMDYQDGEAETKRRKRVRGLFKDIMQGSKEGKPRPIELKVLKNRNGNIGSTFFKFYSRFNYFKNEEEGEDFILTGIEEISLDPELEA